MNETKYTPVGNFESLNACLSSGVERIVLISPNKNKGWLEKIFSASSDQEIFKSALGLKSDEILFEYDNKTGFYSFYEFSNGEKVSAGYQLNQEAYQVMDNFPDTMLAASEGSQKIRESNSLDLGEINQSIDQEDKERLESIDKVEDDKLQTINNNQAKLDEEDKERFETIGLVSLNSSFEEKNKTLTFSLNAIVNNYSLNKVYIESECYSLYLKVKDFISFLEESVEPKMQDALNQYDSLLPELKTRLIAKKYSQDYFYNSFNHFINQLGNSLGDIAFNMQKIMDNMSEQDANLSKVSKKGYQNISSSSNNNTSENENFEFNDNFTPINFSDDEKVMSLVNSIAGILTFNEITSLYDTSFNLTNESSSLTTSYALVGTIMQDDQEYYIVYDKELNKFYYVLVSENVNIIQDADRISVLKQEIFQLGQVNLSEIYQTAMSISGVITFKALTNLYDEEFNLSNHKPNLSENYAFVGTTSKDGIVYYKIYDKTTNKFYYIEASDDITIIEDVESITLLQEEILSIIPDEVFNTLKVVNSINGKVSFTEIVPLYENTLDGNIVEANLSGNYQLFGLIKENGNYYLKIYDLENNKFYFVLANNSVNISLDNLQFVEILEDTMLLSSTEIGTNNFVKLASTNTLYFVTDIVEVDNLTFYSVLDSSDLNTYYIPASNSCALVNLDELINTNSEVIDE